MRKREICREAARRMGFKNSVQAERFFNECMEVISEALMEGELVHLTPIGVLAARYDRRAHVRGRVLKLLAARKFNRKLRGAPVEYPEWYKKLGGE